MGQLLRRLRYLLRRSRHERDLRDEIETHRSLRQAQLERDGIETINAERASTRLLGNHHLAREDVRGIWTPGAFERAWQDLAAGARILRTAPGLTLTAVALVALVIGGNATIYSVVHGVLTKGAPGVDADGLVTVSRIDEHGEPWAESSYERYVQIAAETKTLESLLACNYQRVALGTEAGVYALRAGLVSQNYFDTLRLRLARGRAPSADESRAGAPGLVAVVSDRLWREQLGARDDIVGLGLTINDQHVTVVGVAPPAFQGAWLGEMFDAWLPFSSYGQIVRASDDAGWREAPVIIAGRLAAGVSRAEAQAELALIGARFRADRAESRQRITLVPYSATGGGNSLVATRGGHFLAVFSVITALTLLIVCANVANLMLGRAVNRQREIAVRRSLGCSHARIVRMLVAEGLIVAVLAWAAAIAFAWVVASVLANAIPPPAGASAGFAAWYVRPDASVVAYAAVLTGLATAACVLGPVLFTWRQPLTPWLKAGEQSVVRGRSWLSRGLVVLQLSLSVLLVVLAGLGWRSLSIIEGVDVGFRSDNILIVTVNTAAEEPAAKVRLLDQIRGRLLDVPGVTVVSYAAGAPRGEMASPRETVRAGTSGEPLRAEINSVGPEFIAAHGLTIVTGQDISRAAQPGRPVALVTEHLGRSLWPGASPLGQRVRFGEDGQAEVVGVVPNAFYRGFRRDARPDHVFLSIADNPPSGPEASLYVRFDGPLDGVSAGVRDALGPTGLRTPVVALTTMASRLEGITALPRMLASLVASFGLVALVIATVGQYSVVLFDMRRRVREFGVRLALGASPQRILTSVMREGARLSMIGLVIGGALGLGVGRIARGLLYGVSPADATTYISVAAVLAVTTLAACAIPARLASRVDPLRVLREE